MSALLPTRKARLVASALGLLLTPVVAPSPANAITTCNAGDVCLFDGRDFTNQFFRALGCGDWDLGTMSPPLNNRASSVIIRTSVRVRIYHHYEGKWEIQLQTSGSGEVHAPLNPDNATDRVRVC